MKSIYFLSYNMISFVPYAFGLLKSYAEKDPVIVGAYRWHPPLTILESVEQAVSKIVAPDLLCLSCYVWNHNQQMAIARRVKERYPNCVVVCGGPHVPDVPIDFFTQFPFTDILVHGEGEIPLYHLLKELLKEDPDLSDLKSITFRRQGELVRTPMGQRLGKDLSVPSPYLNGNLSEFVTESDPKRIALWETNRGCPFACSFCDWGVRTKNKVRLHSMERVSREIDYLADNGVEDIYITDANFGLFKRDVDIAELLVKARNRTGFPKRVRIQFAKTSNDTVFIISRLLYENGMLWGTTLSMQSVDSRVLKAVSRPHGELRTYADLKNRYQKHQIPTYTELILGLPNETRDTFIGGICRLLDIGMHEDLRVYELALLPNAPLNRPEMREKFGLRTRFKPIRLAGNGYEKEFVELVFGTHTMPYEDWSSCLLFSEMIQALHNGAFTRFIAIYLDQQGILSYQQFYTGFFETLMAKDQGFGIALARVNKLIDDYYRVAQIPQVNRILTQPDMLDLLRCYHPTRKGWPLWTWLWLSVHEELDSFYQSVLQFLSSQKVELGQPFSDLLTYQREIMLSPDYKPAKGKNVACGYNWQEYFFEKAPLEQAKRTYRFTDTHMGPNHQYPLVANDRKMFVTAAIGYSYPYSKFRHFFHQPDRCSTA